MCQLWIVSKLRTSAIYENHVKTSGTPEHRIRNSIHAQKLLDVDGFIEPRAPLIQLIPGSVEIRRGSSILVKYSFAGAFNLYQGREPSPAVGCST